MQNVTESECFDPTDSILQVGHTFVPYGLFTGIFIPEAMVRSTAISAGAKLAYGRLVRYAGQDGRCFPAVKTLAAEIGMCKRQAQRYLKELEDELLIRRMTRYSGNAQTSNGFEFLWHEMFQSGSTVRQVSSPGDRYVTPPGDTYDTPPVTDPSPKESQLKENHFEESQFKEPKLISTVTKPIPQRRKAAGMGISPEIWGRFCERYADSGKKLNELDFAKAAMEAASQNLSEKDLLERVMPALEAELPGWADREQDMISYPSNWLKSQPWTRTAKPRKSPLTPEERKQAAKQAAIDRKWEEACA